MKIPFTRLLLGQILAISLYALDELALATVMPTIEIDLDGSQLYGAVFAAYVLASLIGVIFGGEETDRTGPVRPFTIGTLLFMTGNLSAAFVQNIELFVLARGIQGLGGGITSAVVYASINIGYEEDKRPTALAYMSASWAIPALIAPVLAAEVTDLFGWRSIFYGLTTLAAVTLWLALPGMRQLRAPEKSGAASKATSLIIPAILLAGGTGSFVYALSQEWAAGYTALGATGFIAIIFAIHKISPGSLKQTDTLHRSFLLKFLIILAFFGMELFLTRLLRDVYDYSKTRGGITLTAAAICWSSSTFIQSRLADRWRAFSIIGTGFSFVVTALFIIGGMLVFQLPGWLVYFAWGLAGSGMGLAMNSLIAASMKVTPEGHEGYTSTMNGLCDSLAIGIASGIGGALINYGTRTGLGNPATYLSICLFMIAVAFMAVAYLVLRYNRSLMLTNQNQDEPVVN